MSIEQKIKNLAKPKESKIEKELVRIVFSCGGAAIKMQGISNKSMPDRLCVFPGGRIWFVETKRPGGKPDPLQMFTHFKLREMGFNVSIVSNAQELKQFENEISGT